MQRSENGASGDRARPRWPRTDKSTKRPVGGKETN